jgi:(1->4)-alpha-D-glucan 1-alpha-D-glucosylmutase
VIDRIVLVAELARVQNLSIGSEVWRRLATSASRHFHFMTPLAQSIADEVLGVLANRRRPRGSTYRLQFNSHFTFRDAAAIVPYLHALGVTHVYASPYLMAQPGSPHGYDVCRHDVLNPEIGTPEDYATFVATLREHGLGQILDVVPNHMAASSFNPWWMDVLENGPSSPFAHYFDIDWRPVKDELAGKVLLPILGEQYGNVLEAGQLRLASADGAFSLHYFSHLLPIGPKTSLAILNHRLDELKATLGEASDAFVEYQSILTAVQHLPPASTRAHEEMVERQREKEVIRRRLRKLLADVPQVAAFIEQNVNDFNGQVGDPHSFDRLDELLQAQIYRLCHWRTASDEVNYRRFFDVNGLAAICVESADVFERSHRLVMQLLARGDVDGLRIDHIDGLLDPVRYLWRLQWSYLAELAWLVFTKRQGVAEPSLSEPPMLAIAASDASRPLPAYSAHGPTPLQPTSQVAGSIGSVVMEQAAEEQQQASIALDPAAAPPGWSELRRAVLRILCDRLRLPFPDRALLEIDGSPIRSEREATNAVPAEDDVYRRLAPNPAELPLYVVVEKILGPDEPLPDAWPVAGTSGYDFLQLANGLLVDPQGFREITRCYERFVGEKVTFKEVMYRCKVLILRFSMSSELQMLAHRLNYISEHHRRARDFTLNMLRLALRETLASFPVYRTYAGPAGVSERDRRFVNQAIARAKRRSPAADTALFDFLRGILLLEHPEGLSDDDRHARELFAGRFQQVTSPVMAKGVEDTAFYLYCPLASVNEVGSHPDVAPVSVESFHQENEQRLRMFPTTMLATSTHDTKRSEDMRARMNVLAEIPHLWRKTCNNWLRLNRRWGGEVDGLPAPSRGDEYLFYETLVGFWPAWGPDGAERADLVARLQAYMEKATHEAKTRTSWVNPNAAYDGALREFIANVLRRKKDNRFLTHFEQFHESVLDWGLYTALSQVALKILSPGVPDIYQGQEFWDFSLVDPDNRRPVDYAIRRQALAELQAAVSQGPASHRDLAARLANSPRDPRLKQYVTWRLLELRHDAPQLFSQGRYVPLAVTGSAARHVCAFAWQPADGGPAERQVVAIIPRLLAQLATSDSELTGPRPLWQADTWGDTRVDFATQGGEFHNLFSGSELPPGPSIAVGPLLAEFPIAVLTTP